MHVALARLCMNFRQLFRGLLDQQADLRQGHQRRWKMKWKRKGRTSTMPVSIALIGNTFSAFFGRVSPTFGMAP